MNGSDVFRRQVFERARRAHRVDVTLGQASLACIAGGSVTYPVNTLEVGPVADFSPFAGNPTAQLPYRVVNLLRGGEPLDVVDQYLDGSRIR